VSDLAPGSIQIKNLTKTFKKGSGSSTYSTLKSKFLFKDKTKNSKNSEGKEKKTFTVLDDINLEIKPGSSLALIGRNGSGKSTLLKLIAGIYTPDKGSVQVQGSLSALIELGAGFHPDFTGRENVFLGGVMFGLSKKQITEKFDDIVTYAELWNVIDEPVRTYSSGMYMRLGFSLAIHTDPDILLVDEVLAVGDAHFISRCHDSISEFKRKGKTLIFVTHDLSSVSRWCDHAIWLDKGKIRQSGSPRDISDSYLNDIAEQENRDSLRLSDHPHDLREKGREGTNWGDGQVQISNVRLLNAKGEEQRVFFEDESMTVTFNYKISGSPKELVFGMGINRADGLDMFGTNSSFRDDLLEKVNNLLNSEKKEGAISYHIDRLGLVEDTYYFDLACHALNGAPYDYHHRIYKFQVRNKAKAVGVMYPELKWEFKANE
jgi:ABC-type polysaccharide/polyol phosphate transport system ATPase subunit